MASLEMTHPDLECGSQRRSSVVSDYEEESVCFSKADEGSCYSQFYSTADGSNDDYKIGQVSDSRRASSVAESVNIKNGGNNTVTCQLYGSLQNLSSFWVGLSCLEIEFLFILLTGLGTSGLLDRQQRLDGLFLTSVR